MAWPRRSATSSRACRGLRVAARSSSFSFKGRHEDVREIGRRLNVASILEGGVRKQGGTVRIDVQLVSAVDGYQVWSETFERRLDDIFKLQTEVACAVITAVRPRAARAERPPPEPATQSFDAYNLYLLGRHHFHKRTEASLRRAMDCFRQAIDRDPGLCAGVLRPRRRVLAGKHRLLRRTARGRSRSRTHCRPH